MTTISQRGPFQRSRCAATRRSMPQRSRAEASRHPGARLVFFGLAISSVAAGLVPGTARAARTASISEVDSSYLPEAIGERLSQAVVLGDVDGSGVRDFAISAPLSDAGGSDGGRVYLFLDQGVSTINGQSVSSATLTLTGEAGARLGSSIAGGLDLNGDGLGDLLIGAPGWNQDSGRVYLFFGRSSWAGVTLASADVVLSGDQVGMQLGGGLVSPGDLSGDGLQDLVVGAPGRDESSTAKDRGMLYLFLGNSLGWSSRTLATADARYRGDGNGDLLGRHLAAPGDVNADGLADFAASAPTNDDSAADAGQVYLFLGSTTLPLGDSAVGSASSVRVRGDAAGDLLGSSLAGGGDVNGDGLADLAFGAPSNDSNGTDAGRVYVLGGRKRDWPLTPGLAQDLAALSFVGGGEGALLGAPASLVLPELSADGLVEIVMGARTADGAAGALYVFLGRSSGWGLVNNVVAADVTLLGEAAGDELGSVGGEGSGDLDRDNRAEVLVGAAGSDVGGAEAGEVFVVDDLARWFDLDADGFTPADGDCDDREPTANPGQTSDPRDDIDNDCDGEIDEDASGGCGSLTAMPRPGVGQRAAPLLGFGLALGLLSLRGRRR